MLKNIYFEFQITELCNLKCQMCDHFAPLSNNSYSSLEAIVNDFKLMSEVIDENYTNINILGGEPLLHPELIQILKYARKSFRKSKIKLYTNGILLKNQNDSFWNACKDYNIIIMVTKYPIKIDYSYIEESAYTKGVVLKYLNTKPVKTSFHFVLDLSGSKDKVIAYKSCKYPNYCVTIKNGKLFICPIRANIAMFNTYFKTNLSLSSKDYLEVDEIRTSKDILNYLSNPIDFCKYCDINEITYNHPWKKSKQSILEWTRIPPNNT